VQQRWMQLIRQAKQRQLGAALVRLAQQAVAEHRAAEARRRTLRVEDLTDDRTVGGTGAGPWGIDYTFCLDAPHDVDDVPGPCGEGGSR